MEKRKPVRTCIVCRANGDKAKMIRIVRTNSGEIDVDFNQRKEGRGCYVCDNDKCLLALKKSRALNRTYKENVGEEVYDRIVKATNQLRKN